MDSVNAPVLYQPEDASMIAALLECGHHTIVAKMSNVWVNPSLTLLCDVCGEENLLHPLVLLEFDYWQEAQ